MESPRKVTWLRGCKGDCANRHLSTNTRPMHWRMLPTLQLINISQRLNNTTKQHDTKTQHSTAHRVVTGRITIRTARSATQCDTT